METVGMVNAYRCEKCKEPRCTINLSTGVTPFMIRCLDNNCGGMAESSMYRLVVSGQLQIDHAWYRPTVEEFHRLSAEEQEHVMNCGLLLGKLGEVAAIKEDVDVAQLFSSGDRDGWLRFVAATYKPPTKLFQDLVERYKNL